MSNFTSLYIKALLVLLFLFTSNTLFGKWMWSQDTLNNSKFGLMAGVNQEDHLMIDAALIDFSTMTDRMEANIGYSYFQASTEYNDFENFSFSSHNIYVDANYFFFKGFYIGGRVGLNFNWVPQDTRNSFTAFEEASGIIDMDSPVNFFGYAASANVGLVLPITENLAFKAQGQLGGIAANINRGSVGVTDFFFVPVSTSVFTGIRFFTTASVNLGVVLIIDKF